MGYTKQREFPNLARALRGWGKEKNAAAKNPVRPSEGAVEGGCGRNSAAPERNQTGASPAALLAPSRATQKKFSFPFKGKNPVRAHQESRENFFVGRAGLRHGGGAASLVPFKVGSRKVYNYSTTNKTSPLIGGLVLFVVCLLYQVRTYFQNKVR